MTVCWKKYCITPILDTTTTKNNISLQETSPYSMHIKAPVLYGLRCPRQPSPSGNFMEQLYMKTLSLLFIDHVADKMMLSRPDCSLNNQPFSLTCERFFYHFFFKFTLDNSRCIYQILKKKSLQNHEQK